MPSRTATSTPTVDELIREGLDGDAVAIAELYRRFKPLLARTLRELRLGPHEADDASQEIVRQFLELVREFSPERQVSFTTYIRSKLRWRIANYLRAERIRRGRMLPLLDANGKPIIEPSVEFQEPTELSSLHLRRALARLSPKQRAVIARYYWQQRTTQQIARELGLTPPATTALRRRAEAALRAYLYPLIEEPEEPV